MDNYHHVYEEQKSARKLLMETTIIVLICLTLRLKLNDNKLKQLFSELKVHDKEHLALKRLKADNGDKDGLREAEIRKQVMILLLGLDLRWVGGGGKFWVAFGKM